jgi:hypothetical protein
MIEVDGAAVAGAPLIDVRPDVQLFGRVLDAPQPGARLVDAVFPVRDVARAGEVYLAP